MALARSVAVAGSISPALLAPSVTSTMTLLFASDRRSRVRAVASPEPMAVPSGSISSLTSSSWRRSTAVSVVGGALVRLLPAKTTRPTRSVTRLFTNSDTTSFATASRLRGWKSWAAMEPDTSRVTTPRVVTSSFRVPCCGRARATDPATRPRAAATSGRWRSRVRKPRGAPCRRERPGKTSARPPRSRRSANRTARGASRASQSHAGSSKRKPARSNLCRLPRRRRRRLFPRSQPRFERAHRESDRRHVPLRLLAHALAPGELDAVRGGREVPERPGEHRLVRTLAEEGHHLRARHLLDGRAQPSLEVALRDVRQGDVENPE